MTLRDGDGVRLVLGVYEAEDQRPLAQGITVTAHRDSIAALSDSVSWAVLRHVWRRGTPPTPSLAAVTTHSLSAMRAFLDGEQAVEKDDWNAASLAYRSAIAADTTFALAYFGYWVSRYWNGYADGELKFPDSSYRSRLPERERLFLEAFSINDSLAMELEKYREVTRRYPDYWPGWFILGDRLHHVGILLGYTWKDAQSALNSAVALNPKLVPAWGHLFMNSIGKDTVESGRALARIPQSDLDRLLQEVASAGGVIDSGASALADSIARERAGQPEAAAYRYPFSMLGFRGGFPAAQVEFDRRVIRFGAPPRIASVHLWGSAWAWAQRGNWDSALVTMREAVAVEPNPPPELGSDAVEEYALAVLGAWLGQIPPAEAAARRPRAWSTVVGVADAAWRKETGGRFAWLDGLLAFAQRDRGALDSARAAARRSGHPYAAIIDLSLAAFARALEGDRPGAAQELAALEWRCVNRWDCGGPDTPNIAIHRMAAALWLLEAGDTAQSARLLTWTEAQFTTDPSFTHAVSPLAYLMRARIEEAQGNTRSATEHYQQFLRRYDSPMPAQRHLVEEARGALARLAGLRDST
jgi:tetratricopeptide (TPR) repeat protein